MIHLDTLAAEHAISQRNSACCRVVRAELDPALRVVVAEEVFEADIPLANVDGGDSAGLAATEKSRHLSSGAN
ncbi:MAG TPA: hypothetical protein VM282_12510 [Acidimicrobiales bacterium]|nr:hypothetical protein [Acidimicrobiales bacterium]